MRILLLSRMTRYHPRSGGMEVHLEQLMDGLSQRGHELTVLTTAHPDGRRIENRGPVPVHFLPGTPPGIYSPAWSTQSTAWIQSAGPSFDVVLAESGSAQTYMEQTGPFRNPPVVTVCHGFTGWTLAGRLRHLRGWRSWRQAISLLRLYVRERLAWLRTKAIYDAVICVSEPLAEAYRREYRLGSDRVIAVPNGIDMVQFQYSTASRAATRQRLQLTGQHCIVLVSGRLEYDKGVHLLLKAIRDLPVRLLVAGDGPEASALYERATGTGTLFLGHVSTDHLAQLHCASDLYAFPTLLNESFGFGALEAMACGRPVVAPLTGGLPMLLQDGVTGKTFTSGNTASLRHALATLVADPDLRQRLGQQAARHVRDRFTLDRMLDGYELVLNSVTRGGATRASSAPPPPQS